MTFLTPILLAGASALLIPLVIHLLNRRRITHVSWGAMHLLHEVLKQKKRRMQVEQWLLLLTRVAIPVVLALCLARPVLNALRQLPGLGKTSLVVLLDDSFSMRAPAADGVSATEQARIDLARILEALPRGSDAQILRIGGSPRPLLDAPATTLDLLAESLADLPAAQGPVNLQDSFQAALAAAQKAGNPGLEILVVSDFQRSDWASLLSGATLPALAALEAEDEAARPALTLFPLPTQLSENLSLAAAELSAQLVAAGQPVALKVRVQNHGQRPWQDVPVHLEADGARLRTARVSVPPAGEASLYFTHDFDSPGDHALTVRLEGDSFTDDNVRHAVVQVREQLLVALIDAAPGSAPLGGSLDFLGLALSPHRGAAVPNLRDLIVTRALDARRLKEADLAGARVAVVGGLQRPSGSLFPILRRFAENGGGVLLLPAENADPARWQRELGKEAEMLPALAAGQEHIENIDFPARLQSARFTHPALLYFNDPRAGRLADGEFQHWWKLEPQGREARVIAALDRGAPLLVERPLGRGLVIQSAVPFTPGWSNLPLQPWFVPLAQRLAVWLATQDTGSSAHLVGGAPVLALEPPLADRDFVLTDPLDQKQDLRPAAGALALPPLLQPGLWQWQPAGSAPGDSKTARQLAVNLDPAESDLTPLTPEELAALAARLNAQTATDFDTYQRLDRSRRLGVEVWKPLLLALLILLFAEVLLQQHLSAPGHKITRVPH